MEPTTALTVAPSGGLTTPTTPSEVAAAWLLGYSGGTRRAYSTDLAGWGAWLERAGIEPFDAHRAHVEAFARDLELDGRAPATIARKLSALASFYAYALDESLIDRSPVARVRRPKVGDESPSTGLDRDELRAFLAAARRSGPRDAALALLLALNGLRISEALGADVADLGTERGHRTLAIVRKGGKRARVPLAAPTAEAIDAYLAGRTDGPLFVTRSCRRVLQQQADKTVRRLARAAGIDGKTVSAHTMRHSFVTAALDAGASLRDVQDAAGHADPRTTRRYDRARHALDRAPTYAVAAALA
jgi:integrase/recombinase XerD